MTRFVMLRLAPGLGLAARSNKVRMTPRNIVRSLSHLYHSHRHSDGRVLDGRRLHIGGVVSTDAGQLARRCFEVG